MNNLTKKANGESANTIPEDEDRLFILNNQNGHIDMEAALSALRQDKVILIQNTAPTSADRIVFSIAQAFGLDKKLEAEAGFASVSEHRKRIGKYFMSVNKRDDYQFIPAHSEGRHSTNMQLAAFYSVENTTDGGETILLNTNQYSSEWEKLGEIVGKFDISGRTLSPHEITQARLLFNVRIPDDLLSTQDQIISEDSSPLPGVKRFNVLEKLQKMHSVILDRELYVYWDSVASYDKDSGQGYFDFLASTGLFKAPSSSMLPEHLDNAYDRRIWSSGINYNSLFAAKITRKLVSGDLVVMNNLSWVHSTNNWTPNSGTRKVAAAFA